MYFGKDLNELTARFASIPKELDVVNIGSGPSYYDFDWSVVPDITGYSMAVSPEDFRYDARVIKNYGNHVKKGGIVVVVVCPLSFVRNDYLYKDSFSEKYVSFLPAEDVDLPKWKYSLYRYCPIVLQSKNIVLRAIKGLSYRFQRVFTMQGQETLNPTEKLVKGWISDNEYLSNLKVPSQAEYYRDVFKEKARDLKKIIDNCQMRELKPIILIPPMSAELRGYISDGFIKSFVYDHLRPIADGGTPVLDYIDDQRYKDEKYYTNGLFLTPEMRKCYTKEVWNDIKKII